LSVSKAHCGVQQIINQTHAAIDKMVYALCGLSEEEIEIVEGNEINKG